MNFTNIHTFTKSELESFLQKVGQHEAAKVVNKYGLNGKKFMLFEGLDKIKFSDGEINILRRCINLMHANPLFNLKLNPIKETAESSFTHTDNTNLNEEEIYGYNLWKKNENQGLLENGHLQNAENEDMPDKRKSSNDYFIFYKLKAEKGNNKFKYNNQQCEIDKKWDSSSSTSSYISPSPILFLPRHEQILVERIKQFVKPDDLITTRRDENPYDVVMPRQIVIHSEGNEQSKDKRRSVFCDFNLSACCFSLALNCYKMK